MTRMKDQMIAEDDGDARQCNPRNHRELAALEASLAAAYQAPTLALLPDYSDIVANYRPSLWDYPQSIPGVDGLVEFKTRHSDPAANERQAEFYRRFTPSRDIRAALGDATAFNVDDWRSIPASDPRVSLALAEATSEDYFARSFGSLIRCNACLESGKLGTFDWAGALFVHLLTCPLFTAKNAQ